VRAFGRSYERVEDPRLLTGGSAYVDDLQVDGALWVSYVTSPVAHGRIVSLDVSGALESPGVADVLTGADVDLPPIEMVIPGVLPGGWGRQWLAQHTVRYVGEPIAAVVAETKEGARDAVDKVVVDIDVLPATVDAMASARSETLLFPDNGANVVFELTRTKPGDLAEEMLFEGCDVVVRQRIRHQRLAPCPLEVRSGAAMWSNGRLIHYASTQSPHMVRTALAQAYGLRDDQVRVIVRDVGGSFGSKQGLYPEEHLLGFISRRLGRPARWTETRSDSMVGLGHGRAQDHFVELGGTSDGRILAFRNTVTQDAGAYALIGAMMPLRAQLMAPGVYDIPRVKVDVRTVVTNTTPVTAYRGAGRPEAAGSIERAVDMFAAAISMDPADLRRQNLVRTFPYDNGMGATYDSGDYAEALDRVLQAADYAQLRREQAARRLTNGPTQIGIGLCVYVEVTSSQGGEWGSVEVTPEGRAVVRVGTCAYGQGHATAFGAIVSAELGMSIDEVDFIQGDTDLIPRGKGSAGSRTIQTAGVSVTRAAEALLSRARQLAADILEADPNDIEIDRSTGSLHVSGVPARCVSWAAIAKASAERGEGDLREDVDIDQAPPTYPSGAHLAVVEVDTETGAVSLLRIIAVDDCGRVLNPLLADGQRHGGMAQGIGQAMFEEFVYDEAGNPLTGTFMDYSFASAADLPSFELLGLECPSPMNPLGAKGVGESGAIGAMGAVHNAVIDALMPYGVDHIDMPCTSTKVWSALQEARASKAYGSAPNA